MSAELRVIRPTKRWFDRLDRKTRDADVRIRCRILMKVCQGETPHAPALALGCAPSMAFRMAARFGLEVFDIRG